jgi:predicted regulator of Ras-like GTPase activity (Roadblock/LC7/MglB family)
MRPIGFAIAVLACAPAFAQSYSGTFTTTNQGSTMVTGQQGNLYLMAQYGGASLVVILAEPGANGQPNLQAARRIVFAKDAAASTAS